MASQNKVIIPSPNQWLWVIFIFTLFFSGGLAGLWFGNFTAFQIQHKEQDIQVLVDLQDQYLRGLDDIKAGRYEIARARFDFILSKDPNFPGASDNLVETLRILNATATFTPLPPTATTSPTVIPTPTPDLRPSADLFKLAQNQLEASNWDEAINLLLTLRKVDLTYHTSQVDGMLFIALRNRGIQKIYQGRDLEGGSYDLTLAERFSPLDGEANHAREVARLYMYGSAFWEADPQQAVYYFSQAAAVAPYLTDASGWTATERYRASLIQYGDQLATVGNWCDAQKQYDLAATLRIDDNLRTTSTAAALQCSPPTSTPTRTLVPSSTVEPSETLLVPTASPTIAQSTSTPTPVPEASTTPQPSKTPLQPTDTWTQPSRTQTQVVVTETPTATQQEVTDTVTPSFTPEPTETPTEFIPPTLTETVTLEPPTATIEPVTPTDIPKPTKTLSLPSETPSPTLTETAAPG